MLHLHDYRQKPLGQCSRNQPFIKIQRRLSEENSRPPGIDAYSTCMAAVTKKSV